ncbi:hypothetical protein V6N13_110819 [Hibiscus sabdariffa]
MGRVFAAGEGCKDFARYQRLLEMWSKLKDRVRHQRKLELERRIESYQGKQLTKEELTDSNVCKKELDEMWEIEERYWHQRARINWLQYGEKNTKFFHAMTLQHRRTNSICRIKNANGEWIEDSNELAEYFQRHFQDQNQNHWNGGWLLWQQTAGFIMSPPQGQFHFTPRKRTNWGSSRLGSSSPSYPYVQLLQLNNDCGL